MKTMLTDILHDANNRIVACADGKDRCRLRFAGERDVELALLQRIEKMEEKQATRNVMREQDRRDFLREVTRRQQLEDRVRSLEQAVRDLQLQEKLWKLQAMNKDEEETSDLSHAKPHTLDRVKTLDTMQCLKHELMLHPVTRPGAEITSEVVEEAICRVPFFRFLCLGKDDISRALSELEADGLLAVWSADDTPSSRASKRRRTVTMYKKVAPCVLRRDHRVEAARIALGVPLSCFF
jgi:hypothetical protein